MDLVVELAGEQGEALYDARLRLGVGPAVAASRFVAAFFTAQGSDPLRPDRGTLWPQALAQTAGDAQYLRDVAVMAVDKAAQDVVDLQGRVAVPPDERLRSVTLEGFAMVDGEPEVTVVILTQQGVAVRLPVRR